MWFTVENRSSFEDVGRDVPDMTGYAGHVLGPWVKNDGQEVESAATWNAVRAVRGIEESSWWAEVVRGKSG